MLGPVDPEDALERYKLRRVRDIHQHSKFVTFAELDVNFGKNDAYHARKWLEEHGWIPDMRMHVMVRMSRADHKARKDFVKRGRKA